jgi:hypothetical protein
MRSYFLNYVQYDSNVTREVEQLNQLVVQYCVDNLYNASVSYVKYINQQGNMYVPLTLPHQKDRDFKELQYKVPFQPAPFTW